jgi:hypothetical protein
MGISGSPTMPIFLQQVFQNTCVQDAAEMLPAMAKYYKWKQDQDVLEYNAEVGESESGIEETTEQENMP